jgi:hypothetical protein
LITHKGRAHFEKCEQLLESQNYPFLRDICGQFYKKISA